MTWKRLRFHFKQTFQGAYRYLDYCGEFMAEAEEKYSCIPQEAKPSGAFLEMPESGIIIRADTKELGITQELPTDNGEEFLALTLNLVALAESHFEPSRIQSNGFAIESYSPMASIDAALAESLKLAGDFHTELAKSVGMSAAFKSLDYNFISGKADLHVTVRPTTFERVSTTKFAAPFHASEAQKKETQRRNQKNERSNLGADHALVSMADLIEYDPPPDALKQQFDKLIQIDDALKKKNFKSNLPK